MVKLNLQETQKMEFEILKEFDRICRKHGLRYTLGGGTLLGAVRHKGFIPWDDDIDVAMPRKDYQRFLHVAGKELPKHLIIHSPYNSYSRFSYTKIMDARTTYIEFPYAEEQELALYIDIFPLDGMVGTEEERKRRKDKVDALDRLLCRFKVARYKRKGEHGFRRIIWNIIAGLNLLLPKYFLIHMLDRRATKYDFDESEYVGSIIGGAGGYKEMIRREEYEMTGEEEFEGCHFMTLKNTDLYLSNLYGDYMQLPPIEERRAHDNEFYLLEEEDRNV